MRKKLFLELMNKIPKLDSRLKNNFFKLIFKPNIYLPYIYFSFFKTFYYKKINFFGKNIKVLIDSFDNYIFAKEKFLFGWWEIHLTGYLIKNFKKNDVFYDVGANTGFYSYLASFFVREIHIFEPIQFYIDLLKENLIHFYSKNKKIYLNKFALLNDNRKIRISYLGGKSRIKENKNTFTVLTKKLDDYLKNRNKPTILKLDTEGTEHLILNGGINFFKKFSPKVFIEIWAKNVKGSENSYKAINLIKKLGYHSYLINDDFTIKEVNFDIPEYLHKIKQSTENVLFMKSKF